jgi:hypothetical protein
MSAFEVLAPVTSIIGHLRLPLVTSPLSLPLSPFPPHGGDVGGEERRERRGGRERKGGRRGGVHLLLKLCTESTGGIVTQCNFVVENVQASTRRIVDALQC